MGLDRDEKLSPTEYRLFEKLQLKEVLTEEEEEMYSIFKKKVAIAEKSLSKTCISYLREEIFIYLKYGERIRPGAESLFESTTRIMKGTLMESAAIDFLSNIDGIKYRKNKKKYKNQWITGYPDINYKKRFGDRKVIDIKCSWDLYTFMNNIPKNISKANESQIQGYISLTNADVGEVCHILVSASDELIEKQVAKLRFRNAFATIEEFEAAAVLTRKSMRFDDIPPERRIIRFPVIRNELEQKSMFDRVDLCREWLMDYQAKHEELFKKK